MRLTIEHDILLKRIYRNNIAQTGKLGVTDNRVQLVIGEIWSTHAIIMGGGGCAYVRTYAHALICVVVR